MATLIKCLLFTIELAVKNAVDSVRSMSHLRMLAVDAVKMCEVLDERSWPRDEERVAYGQNQVRKSAESSYGCKLRIARIWIVESWKTKG